MIYDHNQSYEAYKIQRQFFHKSEATFPGYTRGEKLFVTIIALDTILCNANFLIDYDLCHSFNRIGVAIPLYNENQKNDKDKD